MSRDLGMTGAADDAMAMTRAAGLDLDDPRGAEMAFAAIVDALAALPLSGQGHTRERFAGLAAVAAVDVTLGRLAEAHTDALAILAELDGGQPPEGSRWGVWAAEGPGSTVSVTRGPAGHRLSGAKPWCSGAALCTHALVTAAGPGGGRSPENPGNPQTHGLYAVTLDPATARGKPGSWRAVGLAGSGTEVVQFQEAAAVLVGEPGSYLTRPGFWPGAIGVAAVWWGAAAGIAAPMYAAAGLGPHALAHRGAVEAALSSTAAALREAAAAIDGRGGVGVGVGVGGTDAGDASAGGERLALTVRALVEAAASDVMGRVGKALGPGPLCQDRAHARRVADLTVYLRQSHAERDLERLGRLTADSPAAAL